MASLFNDINSSDDSDDADYKPEEAVYSSDEDNGPCTNDEIETGKKSKKRKLKPIEESTQKLEEPKASSSVAEKKSADDLFRDFLADVEKETSSSLATDSCYGSPSSSMTQESPKSELSSSENLTEINTPKVFDFAGETVSVPKDVLDAADVKPVPKKKGLSAVLDSLQKKPKLTVLGKSKLDWLTYKAENGIEEDLKQFNRGRGGFIERKRFLEKCDQKSFEMERDMRMKIRKS